MEILNSATQKILLSILRHAAGAPTISTLQEELKMSHVGVWKAVKKVESESLIYLKQLGNKKNSTYTLHLNWDNLLLEKTLVLALEHEATNQRRWVSNFHELKSYVDFLIVYGSAVYKPQNTRDIDIIGVHSKNKIEAERIIMKLQKTQLKKIHFIDFTPKDLKDELKKPNIAFINALKEGVVLFGQDKFIEFMRELHT